MRTVSLLMLACLLLASSCSGKTGATEPTAVCAPHAVQQDLQRAWQDLYEVTSAVVPHCPQLAVALNAWLDEKGQPFKDLYAEAIRCNVEPMLETDELLARYFLIVHDCYGHPPARIAIERIEKASRLAPGT